MRSPESATSLPTELLELIGALCTAADVCRLRAVCREWRALFASDVVWAALLERDYAVRRAQPGDAGAAAPSSAALVATSALDEYRECARGLRRVLSGQRRYTATISDHVSGSSGSIAFVRDRVLAVRKTSMQYFDRVPDVLEAALAARDLPEAEVPDHAGDFAEAWVKFPELAAVADRFARIGSAASATHLAVAMGTSTNQFSLFDLETEALCASSADATTSHTRNIVASNELHAGVVVCRHHRSNTESLSALYDLREIAKPARYFAGSPDTSYNDCAVLSGGNLFAFGTGKSNVHVHDARKEGILKVLACGSDWIWGMGVGLGHVVCAAGDNRVFVFNETTLELEASFPFTGSYAKCVYVHGDVALVGGAVHNFVAMPLRTLPDDGSQLHEVNMPSVKNWVRSFDLSHGLLAISEDAGLHLASFS